MENHDHNNQNHQHPSQQRQLRKIKRTLTGFILIASLILGGEMLSLQKNTQKIEEKEIKLSVLIDEVGTLKENMEEKNKVINGILEEIVTVSKKIQQISTQFTVLDGKEKNFASMSKELTENQQKLALLLKEKEKIIGDLASKNEKLSKELSLPPYPKEVFNVLVVGHNSGLADTIIIASVDPKKEKITTVSIPRDLWHEGRKINELYSKFGIEELKKAAYEVTGVPIDKYVVFDFTSFTALVDGVGGIEIEVPQAFTDTAYPGENFSYRTVSFAAGVQQMDGKRALEYARSRKSSSDFERSKRQQEVIKALKEKMLTLNIGEKTELAMSLYQQIQKNIKTDASILEAISYFQAYRGYEWHGGNVISTQNYLVSSKSSTGQYILLPKEGTYAEIKMFLRNLIAN